MSFMLSLATNPYNPFTDYQKWKVFDRQEGFDTDGLLARTVSSSSQISFADQDIAVEDAIDSILANPSFDGLYIKVESPD